MLFIKQITRRDDMNKEIIDILGSLKNVLDSIRDNIISLLETLSRLNSQEWATIFFAGLLLIGIYYAKEQIYSFFKRLKLKIKLREIGFDPYEKGVAKKYILKQSYLTIKENGAKDRVNIDGQIIDSGMYISFIDHNDQPVRGIFIGATEDVSDPENPFFIILNFIENENGCFVKSNLYMDSIKSVKSETILLRREFDFNEI